jgi:hypothetical protein
MTLWGRRLLYSILRVILKASTGRDRSLSALEGAMREGTGDWTGSGHFVGKGDRGRVEAPRWVFFGMNRTEASVILVHRGDESVCWPYYPGYRRHVLIPEDLDITNSHNLEPIGLNCVELYHLELHKE